MYLGPRDTREVGIEPTSLILVQSQAALASRATPYHGSILRVGQAVLVNFVTLCNPGSVESDHPSRSAPVRSRRWDYPCAALYHVPDARYDLRSHPLPAGEVRLSPPSRTRPRARRRNGMPGVSSTTSLSCRRGRTSVMRQEGVEPSSYRWQRYVVPLDHNRVCPPQESNPHLEFRRLTRSPLR